MNTTFSGFTLDKESNTVAVICQELIVVLAFDTREHLMQWQVKIAANLGEGKFTITFLDTIRTYEITWMVQERMFNKEKNKSIICSRYRWVYLITYPSKKPLYFRIIIINLSSLSTKSTFPPYRQSAQYIYCRTVEQQM